MRRSLIVLAALFALTLARADEQKPADQKAAEKQAAKPREESFIHPQIVDDLSLTKEQKDQVHELRDQFAKDRDAWMDAHKADREVARKEKEDAKTSGDKAKIAEANKKWLDLFRPLADMRRQYMDKFKAILTVDQKEKLQQILTQRRGEHKEQKAKKTAEPKD